MTETLPHNLDAEQAVLGALLYDCALVDEVDAYVGSDHFYDPVHGRIFDGIATRHRVGRKADAISMKSALAGDKGFDEIGGAEHYLSVLLDSAADNLSAVEYAKIIRDMSARREIITLAKASQTRADEDMAVSGADIASDMEGALSRIQETGTASITFSSGDDGAQDVIDGIEEARNSGGITGVRTGMAGLDERTGGLQRGNLCIVAGRPSMGKTALAGVIAQNAAMLHRPDGERQKVFFQSLEMTRRQVWQRAVVSELKALGGQTHLGMMRRGIVAKGDEQVLQEAAGKVRELKGSMLVDDTRGLSVLDIKRRARAASREMGGLDLLVIDYLGLIAKPDFKGRNEASVIGEITFFLKALAGEMDIPIILLSQLSRMVEQRDNKRPMLSDLRDSGAIEQDADDVFFVYRDAYYLKRELDAMPSNHAKYADTETEFRLCEHTLEVICAKQRQGPIGIDKLRYEQAFNYITDQDGGS